MTEVELKIWKGLIDKMTHVQLCHLTRFAPVGHPVFQRGALNDYFNKKFTEAGGMTPEISKLIGWKE